jgi:hypothetical protein
MVVRLTFSLTKPFGAMLCLRSSEKYIWKGRIKADESRPDAGGELAPRDRPDEVVLDSHHPTSYETSSSTVLSYALAACTAPFLIPSQLDLWL